MTPTEPELIADYVAALEAENQRHQRANLVRAVTDGWGDRDDWITEVINNEAWDAVPWKVAEAMRAENERLRALTVDDPTSIYHDQAAERALADRLAGALRYERPISPRGRAALAAWESARKNEGLTREDLGNRRVGEPGGLSDGAER